MDWTGCFSLVWSVLCWSSLMSTRLDLPSSTPFLSSLSYLTIRRSGRRAW